MIQSLGDDELDFDFEEDNPSNSNIQTEQIERFNAVVAKGTQPIRIDKYLHNHIENITRNKIQTIINQDKVLVDGQPVTTNFKVKSGMHIVMYETRMMEYLQIIPEQMNLDIIYEDEDILVLNKAPNMVVHPGCGNYSGTIVNGLTHYLNPDADPKKPETMPKIGLVHRIDKDTSGLLLIAKKDKSMQFLADQFKKHTVYRRYIGLAWGNYPEEEGTITAHIGRHQRYGKKMDAYPNGDFGKHAITHFKVLERLKYVSLLEYRLETGRTHQIRVHNMSIGCPLFNDATYGGNTLVKGTKYEKYENFVNACFAELPRHALHARELGFIHPSTKEEMRFTSDIPKDIQTVLDMWRGFIHK